MHCNLQGAPADIAQLSRELLSRVATSKRAEPCKQSAPSRAAAERLDTDYLDKPTPDDYEDEPFDEDTSLEAEQLETNVDSKDEAKALKRKEPVQEETSPKRQCPKIIVEW